MTVSPLATTDDLPNALLEREQWLCWREQDRDGKPTKVPIDPHTDTYGSATDPETWASFEIAREFAIDNTHIDGIGFVFTDEDPFVGVDLDDCRVPETETTLEWAIDVLERLDSYTEVSPSGTGYHVIIRGTLPDGRNRKDDIELYETARFFTVTGDHLAGTPTAVVERDQELAAVHAEYVVDESIDFETDDSDRATVSEGDDESTDSSSAVDIPDDELLERATNAANGAKFERLWNGSTSGYDSHSEADMALCSLLAFWTGGDHNRVDRLFRDSGLYRDKWDEIHYSDGSTYGEKTVARAVAGTDEYYSPSPETNTGNVDASETLEKRSLQAEVEALESRETSRLETVEALAAHLQELGADVETLREQNERLRAELARERDHRQALEQQLDAESNSVWVRLRELLGL